MDAELLEPRDDGVLLRASTCGACELVAFPPERYGCERCGALPEQHEVGLVPSSGRVRRRATVHRHHRPEPATPFVVVEVTLDAGPSLKAVAGNIRVDELMIGDRMRGAVTDDRFVFVPEVI